MSSLGNLFRKPRTPSISAAPAQVALPAEPEPIEEVQMVEETAEEARRRERKRLFTGGRRATILSGIQSALKKRLGA